MDLASGYSDSINYGNGYTPLANNAIANNNANYAQQQAMMAAYAQAYNPFANSGGSFGAMPAAYAGLGADYGRAVGGGGNIYAPQQQSVFDTGAQPYNNYGGNDYFNWEMQQLKNRENSGGIGSDAVGAPNQPALTPQQYYTGGYNPYSPQTFAPSAQQNVGTGQPNVEAPKSVFDTGTSAFNPYASQPWWSTFEKAAGPQGVTDWLRGQGVSSGGSRDNIAQALMQQAGGAGIPYSGAQVPDTARQFPNIDPQFDRTPEAVLGHRGTWDWNILDQQGLQRAREYEQDEGLRASAPQQQQNLGSG
jgi:hypothetical protein